MSPPNVEPDEVDDVSGDRFLVVVGDLEQRVRKAERRAAYVARAHVALEKWAAEHGLELDTARLNAGLPEAAAVG